VEDPPSRVFLFIISVKKHEEQSRRFRSGARSKSWVSSLGYKNMSGKKIASGCDTYTSHTRGGHATCNHQRPQRTREYNTYISHYKTSNGRHRHSWAAPGISMRGSFYADSPARLTRTQRDPDNAHTTRTPVHPIPASTKPNRGTCSSAMSIPSALVMPARCCAPSTRPPRVA
jgi:hypothetical protein